MRRMHRSVPKAVVSAMCAVVAAAGLAMTVSTPPASADPSTRDPSTCGARAEGPTYEGGLLYGYYIYNRCVVRRKYTVYLPTFGRKLNCRRIDPGATVGYSSVLRDMDWRAVPC
jgi:hypothetical protein